MLENKEKVKITKLSIYLKTLRAKETQRKHKEGNSKSKMKQKKKHKIMMINKCINWPFENINKHAKLLMYTD